MRLFATLSVLVTLIGHGFSRKVKMTTDYYETVEDSGNVYKVYNPIDENE